MDRWVVGLDAWVIQDGNYGDFRRGDRVELAIEFSTEAVTSAPAMSVGIVSDLGEGEYDAVGTVVYSDRSLWIVDIGICAYSELPPDLDVVAGSRVRGGFKLEVDPFMYVEQHARSPAVPPLVYTWQLEQIRRQAAPLVETASGHFERDRSRWSWSAVEATDAWNDDGGYATYLLECVRLPEPPKRTSATAVTG